MEAIFHEKQEGSLCAQHCLNALLQGPYFTPVDLGSLAQKMDDEERLRMAECGVESEEYQKFLQQPSGNMDDSGYFSVQVISSALEVWGLELVPYTSAEKRARDANEHPNIMKAFICNYKDHWFTIRKLGQQWFNLNSLLSKPELISDTYLALFLAQLQQEGYSIFIVFGTFPECEADKLLKICPAVPPQKTVPKNVLNISKEDADLQKALEMSLHEDSPSTSCPKKTDDLEKAMALSLEAFSQESEDSDSEETQLRKAIQMSLECKSNSSSTPSTPNIDVEDVRRKRILFMEKSLAGCSTKSDS